MALAGNKTTLDPTQADAGGFMLRDQMLKAKYVLGPTAFFYFPKLVQKTANILHLEALDAYLTELHSGHGETDWSIDWMHNIVETDKFLDNPSKSLATNVTQEAKDAAIENDRVKLENLIEEHNGLYKGHFKDLRDNAAFYRGKQSDDEKHKDQQQAQYEKQEADYLELVKTKNPPGSYQS